MGYSSALSLLPGGNGLCICATTIPAGTNQLQLPGYSLLNQLLKTARLKLAKLHFAKCKPAKLKLAKFKLAKLKLAKLKLVKLKLAKRKLAITSGVLASNSTLKRK